MPNDSESLPTPEFITEDWLRSGGFKWHEGHQYVSAVVKAKEKGEVLQPRKHWILWFGAIANREPDGKFRMWSDDEDLGLELAPGHGNDPDWFCWLRSDTAGRYHRFIHLRHVREPREVVAIIVALTNTRWKPENHKYGRIMTDEQVAACEERDKRLDIVIAKQRPWYESEKDEASGPADITDLKINREKMGFV